ncbi:hypothetical protein GN244_ATG05327 [Phytophthora infestans]|uniref:Uncharacterized protein n=1 Tax=Phytophthora infestans TaxID=4787 RepID=A0A833TKQ5_PHYIN|nr:hypothetical protein GN244_ATG05327 [Phytophthora infestans]
MAIFMANPSRAEIGTWLISRTVGLSETSNTVRYERLHDFNRSGILSSHFGFLRIRNTLRTMDTMLNKAKEAAEKYTGHGDSHKDESTLHHTHEA